jgi:ornithine cyclodeaminase/alanine dehydrogenase-like protein (mu-crystallin family)
MTVRILNQAEVTALLPMEECIEVMDRVLRTLSSGGAIQPLRSGILLPEGRGVLGAMPGALLEPLSFGLKAIVVFPGNDASPYDSHQGLVLLFDPEHGFPIAIIDASSVTAIRTAAVSAVATRALARRDADDLAILGSGVQARTHLEAMAAVRPLSRVRAWSPNRTRLEAFIDWARKRLGIAVEAPPGPREAVTGAAIVCTCTSSRTPVVQGAWLADGAHINAVGSSLTSARELDTAAVVRGRLVVDRLESALNEAGDFLIPRAEGAVSDAHILGELGDVLLGRIEGRTGPGDVTIFKSLGLAVEDLAAAEHVLRQAEARGVGLVTDLGGRRD